MKAPRAPLEHVRAHEFTSNENSRAPAEDSKMIGTLGRIGLGCVTFGREIDEAASFALMDHALARGVKMFDTAAAYSGGGSERIVGAWLGARRPASEAVMVATKLQPPYTAAAIGASVTASRARLGLQTIPLLYLHQWHPTAETDDALAELDRLVRVGEVGALGISNISAAQLEGLWTRQQALGFARIEAIQNNHNVAVREAGEALREGCRRRGIAIVTYSPLGAGFLTGKHQAGAAPGTRFTIVSGHQQVYFTETAFRRLERLREVAAAAGLTTTQLALAWALHQPGVDCTLVGGRTPAHLDQAFEALTFDDPAVFAALTSD
jgi:aryl-alcohol dehydrogenase-like predicted oxidoreductase